METGSDPHQERLEPSERDLREAAWALARLARSIEQACQQAGISLPQYRLLALVSRRSRRAGELAGRAAVSRPTLTALVDGLERQGLLRRIRVEDDRRGVLLEATDAGTSAIERAERSLVSQLRTLVEESGAHRLPDALRAVGAALDRRTGGRDDPDPDSGGLARRE